MSLQGNSRVIFYKKRVRIKTIFFFFSALLCELCASAVAIFSFFNRRGAEFAEERREERKRIYGLSVFGCSWGKDEACRSKYAFPG